MKTGNRTILVFILLAFSAMAQAQLKGFSIGGFVEGGWPTAGFEDTHNRGIGVGIGADIKLPANLGLTGSIGYMHFGGKVIRTNNSSSKIPAISAVPIRAGLKYRFSLLYAKLEGGIAKITNNNNTSAYIVSPGVGIRVLGLDVQGKFEAWFKEETWSFWGLKVGYNF